MRAATVAGFVTVAAGALIAIVSAHALDASGGTAPSTQPVRFAATGATLEQVAQTAEACAKNWDPEVEWPAVTADDVILSQRLGDVGVTLMRMGDSMIECEDQGRGQTPWTIVADVDITADSRRAVTVNQGAWGAGSDQYSHVAGVVAEGVTEVDIVDAAGRVVAHAQVAEGWFAAVWPGASDGEAGHASSVVARSSDAETSYTFAAAGAAQ